eukprot:5147416-Prymnesium_polylepis.1
MVGAARTSLLVRPANLQRADSVGPEAQERASEKVAEASELLASVRASQGQGHFGTGAMVQANHPHRFRRRRSCSMRPSARTLHMQSCITNAAT